MNKLETIPEELVAQKSNGLARLLEAVAVAPPPAIRSGFASKFITESIAILEQLDVTEIERMAAALARVRENGGRLFILGVGGSAGHAGHAVNDFRKICGFEAYAPTDNVSELTALRTLFVWLLPPG